MFLLGLLMLIHWFSRDISFLISLDNLQLSSPLKLGIIFLIQEGLLSPGNNKEIFMKRPLEDLSLSLQKVHRSLVDVEKQLQEEKDQERIQPGMLLQNCINHPNFEWLKDISGAISAIDEADDEQGKLQSEIFERLQDIFIDDTKHPEVKKKIQMALEKDPPFTMDLAILKSKLGKML
jgi:hypothetical protein